MKKLIISLIVIAALFLAGCPNKEKTQKTIRDFREASAQIQIYGRNLIKANTEAFQAGEIDQPTFAELTRLTGKFVDGVNIYRDALKEAEKLVDSGQILPKDKFDALEVIFSEKVADAFLAITKRFNLIPELNTETVKTILAGIRIAIMTIQDAFSRADAVYSRHQLWI